MEVLSGWAWMWAQGRILVGSVQSKIDWTEILEVSDFEDCRWAGIEFNLFPYVHYQGKRRRIGKALAGTNLPRGQKERILLACGRVKSTTKTQYVWVSRRKGDFYKGAEIGNSCLSPGGCNSDTITDHINYRSVIVYLSSDPEGEKMVARKWGVMNARAKYWLEATWYGGCESPEADSLVRGWLAGHDLLSSPEDEGEVNNNFAGWLDYHRRRMESVQYQEERCSWYVSPWQIARKSPLLIEGWEMDGWYE